MLKVTEKARSVFQKLVDQDGGTDVIRLVPDLQSDGQQGIGIEALDEPGPTDRATQSEGPDDSTTVIIVVAAELAPALDDAVLDAQETDEGADLYLRPQSAAS
jgi:Fe-S cluster assembly iron-binding protein IscA